MSITSMRRVSIFCLARSRKRLIKLLQAEGVFQPIPPRDGRSAEMEMPERVVQARKALKYLLDCPRKHHPVHDAGGFQVKGVIRDIQRNMDRTRRAQDWLEALKARLALYAPWGRFQFPALDDIDGHRFWFYAVPHYRMSALADCPLPWRVCRRDNRNAYIVVISRDEPPAEAVPAPRLHTGHLSPSALETRIARVHLELDELRTERERLTRWIHLLSAHLVQVENEAERYEARDCLQTEGEIARIDGWAPAGALDALERTCETLRAAMVARPPHVDEAPPTLLENPPAWAGGEEIVRFYQMPGYRSWDPSLVLFFSFALFFAMILSDAGYALVFGVTLWLFRRRMGRSETGARLYRLGQTVAAASLAYGVLAGSYFGVAPPPESLPGLLHILDVRNFEQMMRLSVVVGVLHLVIANATVAWQRSRTSQALAPVGWILVLLGGLVAWFGAVSAGSTAIGVGLILVFMFSGDTPWRDKRWWRRPFAGLVGLTRLSKAFGDVLSYLRLFALGLASASLAATFNDLGAGLIEQLPGLGVLLAVLVWLAGHVLNVALCLMSGVVHGLRLNVIEFYNWGISDEGYPFKPIRKRETATWTS